MMSKQRFIERLNLYLDGELAEEESAELLEAIRRNPEYYRLYVQYCQLHNACAQLGGRFVETRSTPSWRQKAYAVAGMAAAGALLLLAARNLSPLIAPASDGPSIATAGVSGPVGKAAEEESYLVVDVEAMDGQRFRFGESAQVVTFNLDDAFDRGGQEHNFGLDSQVEFASYTVVQDSGSERQARRDFSLGEAVRTSTFEHEMLSSEEARALSARDMGSALEQAESEFHFDLSRAAMTAKARPAR